MLRGLRLLPVVLLAACSGGDGASTGLLPPDDGGSFVRDTGGKLSPHQACYDVLHYDLAMQVFPDRREIEGALAMRFEAVSPTDRVLMNLDPALTVREVRDNHGDPLRFEHRNDQLMIGFAGEMPPGDVTELTVVYGGKPRTAPRPPWEGGFQWEQTPSGAHWIATSCQMEGADLWWPCKDHPSDKPEDFDLHFRVPADLVAASNGALDRVEDHGDGTVTYHWKVTTPIPNYTVALNVAPYEKLTADYVSVAGTPLPVQFWVLPESVEDGRAILPEFVDHLRWFEETLGPYPFRADKYGVVQTPHLGMEHQTIIAYGNDFRDYEFGFDWLHHHELAHEWFANHVTAPDWNDFWIHEGIATYLQKLYVEERDGSDAYRDYLASIRGSILNAKPVAPRAPRSSGQMYFLDPLGPEGQKPADSDIYFKGAWVLHSLRWLIGEDALMESFRKACYPTPFAREDASGGAVRFLTTDEYRELLERLSGDDLGWFFELYLRQPALPELVSERAGDELVLRWDVPEGQRCELPVEVFVGGLPERVAMPGGEGRLAVPAGAAVELDPFDRVLRLRNHCLGGR